MMRAVLIWGALFIAVVVPIAVALQSPLLAWRDGIYISAGLAGVGALCLLLIQPLVIAGDLPGLRATRARHAHRAVGAALVLLVVLHVGGLWVTSPPDVVDALLFRSPTPFSAWGVVAMIALFATAGLAATQKHWRGALRRWQIAHGLLAVVIVSGSLVHAVQIEGTMGFWSKLALCLLVLAASTRALLALLGRILRTRR